MDKKIYISNKVHNVKKSIFNMVAILTILATFGACILMGAMVGLQAERETILTVFTWYHGIILPADIVFLIALIILDLKYPSAKSIVIVSVEKIK
jgi:hypothetical protein